MKASFNIVNCDKSAPSNKLVIDLFTDPDENYKDPTKTAQVVLEKFKLVGKILKLSEINIHQ
jgi:hypothetical protein